MSLSEVQSDSIVQLIYDKVSPRTLTRDIYQLRDKGFLKLTHSDDSTMFISIDLNAIEKY